jgi:hypothetical protein
LTCIPAFASAASKTFSPASTSTACPTYEGYPDCAEATVSTPARIASVFGP